jgi:hypothetical protein
MADALLRQATQLAEANQLRPVVGPSHFTLTLHCLAMKQWSKEM